MALFCSALRGDAEDVPWNVRVWRLDGDFRNERITDLAQTKDGYLWLATRSGLVRFDGAHFDYYRASRLFGKSASFGRVLFQAEPYAFTAVMNKGTVGRFQGGQIGPIASGLPDDPQEAVEDRDGFLWVSFRGGGLWRIKGEAIEQMTPAHGLPEKMDGHCNLARDKDGNVWFAADGYIGIWRDGRFEVLHRGRDLSTKLYPAKGGGMWFFQGFRLCMCDVAGRVVAVGKPSSPPPSMTPTVLLEDRTGAVWIGTTESGLFRFANSNFKIYRRRIDIF
jgi:ligand-binding sensor domain-containing protein